MLIEPPAFKRMSPGAAQLETSMRAFTLPSRRTSISPCTLTLSLPPAGNGGEGGQGGDPTIELPGLSVSEPALMVTLPEPMSSRVPDPVGSTRARFPKSRIEPFVTTSVVPFFSTHGSALGAQTSLAVVARTGEAERTSSQTPVAIPATVRGIVMGAERTRTRDGRRAYIS